jgi:prepilin-type N-terminal cleavage/methylation domain-containing protein/prepilin-type processing-associated H-X9-DG protein
MKTAPSPISGSEALCEPQAFWSTDAASYPGVRHPSLSRQQGATGPYNPAPSGRPGFSLIELLVVIAVIAILAAMLMPALTVSKSKAQSVSCLNNLKQLQAAWLSYTGENADSLPNNKWRTVNWDADCPSGAQRSDDAWVLGDARFDTTTWNLQHGSLFPYIGATGSYHCPTDQSMTLRWDMAPQWSDQRKRSYSMSYYMNGSEHKRERKTKLCQILNTARVFVFLDEHETSIDDGVFFVHVPEDAGEQAEGPHWMDLPADRHNLGCNFSYADGHVRPLSWRWPKRWSDPSNHATDVANELDKNDLRRLQEGIPTL